MAGKRPDPRRQSLADRLAGAPATPLERVKRGRRALVPLLDDIRWVNGQPPGGGGPDFRAAEAGGTVWYTDDADAWDLAHEGGHAFFERVLADRPGAQARLQRIMRVKGPWVGDPGAVSADEVFSDWYANARMGQGPGFKRRTKYGMAESWDPGYGVEPASPKRYRQFLKIVNRAYERAGL